MTRRFSLKFLTATGLAVFLAAARALNADTAANGPDFKEVYDLLKQHMAGASASDLDQAAVQGLLNQLHAKVSLVSGPAAASNEGLTGTLLAKCSIFDGPVVYFRISHVKEGLASDLMAAYKTIASTNQLKGIVLDLRFAEGHDYGAATAVADMFMQKTLPLLDWGNGLVRSKSKSDAISLPVAVLVNQKTSGSAEALAAMFREANRGLLLGGVTAGAATIEQEFPLKNGQRLRIATAMIKLGDGEALSVSGVKPDIQVAVKEDDEKIYFSDPFKEFPASQNFVASASGNGSTVNGTNHTRTRINEADLIRERKKSPGVELDDISVPDNGTSTDQDSEKPVVRDPVLARALDLLKAIAVLKAPHPA